MVTDEDLKTLRDDLTAELGLVQERHARLHIQLIRAQQATHNRTHRDTDHGLEELVEEIVRERASGRVVPLRMPREHLADLLRDLSDAVRSGDTAEGRLSWLLPEAAPYTDVMVEGFYRVGNLGGQGGGVTIAGMTK